MLILTGQFPEVLRRLTEVAVLWFLIYQGLKVGLGNSRAVQVVKVLVFMLLVMYAAFLTGFQTIYWLTNTLMPGVTVALVVLYAPELRRTVTQLTQLNVFSRNKTARSALVGELLRAARTMSSRHIGALIVFERQNSLEGFIETGVDIDGLVTSEMLLSIFSTRAPLHDGAVIVKNERIAAASCLLPLTTAGG